MHLSTHLRLSGLALAGASLLIISNAASADAPQLKLKVCSSKESSAMVPVSELALNQESIAAASAILAAQATIGLTTGPAPIAATIAASGSKPALSAALPFTSLSKNANSDTPTTTAGTGALKGNATQ